MTHDGIDGVQYFYNTRTRMVEKGRQSSWEHLLGPFDTEEEARGALEKAQERNEAWEEQDEREAQEEAEWRGDE